ncbi:MAG TPA: saccharopine dehydrogenase C-terminal domain-containing protein [Candidatus Limnocylindria bacterium]|nr:saccharopine dehydrogenase C-terminal domain-containing protein [Candidatus Limnocylindria bacterium]
MRILLIGVGTVGEAIASLATDREWCEAMVLADVDAARAGALADRLGDAARFPAISLDASSAEAVAAAARAHGVDLVMNAVDPRFVMPIFEGALAAGVHYMDMANSLSKPHPERPFELPGVKLGDEQFARGDAWAASGRMALLGMGMDPGLTDVFAAHAAKHLYDEVHEVHIRDGGDLHIPGYAFAPVFSIWTTIEECLNPPVVWQDGAWHTTEPFSAPERFPFPEGIGPVECVNVEHEEVLLVPRALDAKRVTFKYALGAEFIEKLKFLHDIGLDRVEKVKVRGVEVSPRDVVAAVVPDPIGMGDKMRGRAIVGTWVIGTRDGQPRETFHYQMADAQETMARYGSQVVGWQTGFNPVIAMELIATGAWSASGVIVPEQLDPDPYLALLDRYGIHHAVAEMQPGAHRPT